MKPHSLLMILFGATGDLAARKLYPAIYRLYKNNHISEHFALIGTARRPWSDDHFRQVVLDSIADQVDDPDHAQEFASHFYYQSNDVTDSDHYIHLQELAQKLDQQYQTQGNRIFYISLSPKLFPVITGQLKAQDLLTNQGYNRLIIEKPFGYDYQTAAELQAQLTQTFKENQIYRIDHYLGKEAIASIKNIRFNNTLFAPLWNKKYIDNIQISLAEDIGVEDRGAYYESSGVVKDMIQNHALQILALLTMDEPVSQTSEDFRKAKINILQHLRPFQSPDQVNSNVVRGQYGPSLDGHLKGYRQEENVASDSTTETFVAAKISINLPQWEGVPIFIRSGKRMDQKSTTINVIFKGLNESEMTNRLSIEIAPKLGYQLFLNIKEPGYSNANKVIPFSYELNSDQASYMPQDYERLIYDCIEGNLSNFTHFEEVANAWKFVDSIYENWEKMETSDFPNYPAGCPGPKKAQELLAKHQTYWY